MEEQEGYQTGAVETPLPTAQALRLAKTIGNMRHPPLSVDLVVLIARDIDRFAQQAVEAERVSEADYLRSMAEICIRICKNTSGDETIERIVILFGSIERNAAIVERARIARIEKAYQRDVASLDNRENGARAERARIVAALEARKQTAAIGEERALKQDPPDWAKAVKYQQEAAIFDEAIAIAREEGGG